MSEGEPLSTNGSSSTPEMPPLLGERPNLPPEAKEWPSPTATTAVEIECPVQTTGENAFGIRRAQLAATLASFAGTVGSVTLYIIAILLNPEYSLGSSSISKLGIAAVSWPFNIANLLAGVSTANFAWFTFRPTLGQDRKVGRVCLSVLLFAAFTGALLGPVSSHFYRPHVLLASIFFLSAAAAFCLLACSLDRSKEFGRSYAVLSSMTAVLILSMLGGVMGLIAGRRDIQFVGLEWELFAFWLEAAAVLAILLTLVTIQGRSLWSAASAVARTGSRPIMIRAEVPTDSLGSKRVA